MCNVWFVCLEVHLAFAQDAGQESEEAKAEIPLEVMVQSTRINLLPKIILASLIPLEVLVLCHPNYFDIPTNNIRVHNPATVCAMAP